MPSPPSMVCHPRLFHAVSFLLRIVVHRHLLEKLILFPSTPPFLVVPLPSFLLFFPPFFGRGKSPLRALGRLLKHRGSQIVIRNQ
ncbi:hypothetical protein LY76DRAFT_114788 [Colletotrichum caudatum]|nr:hypothetical protein LY76DRAFT_114788 [Colletotrichum caudatum]